MQVNFYFISEQNPIREIKKKERSRENEIKRTRPSTFHPKKNECVCPIKIVINS